MNQFHILCFNVAYLFFNCGNLICRWKEVWWVERDGWMEGGGMKGKEADKRIFMTPGSNICLVEKYTAKY